jgi:ribosomal protein L29
MFNEILGEIEDDTPMKKKLFEYETPSKTSNELIRFQNTQTFLSPTTKELQRSIEKAAASVKVVYNTHELKTARKNILQSVDYILSHELVMENSLAAEFVAELERKVQEIKEKFTKTVHTTSGTMQGNDSELTFPAFLRRKTKHVDKRFRGLSG